MTVDHYSPTDLDGSYAARAVQVNGRPRTHVDIARRWHDRTAVALASLVAEPGGGFRPPPGF